MVVAAEERVGGSAVDGGVACCGVVRCCVVDSVVAGSGDDVS